jgi:hypothetical protein
MRSRDLFLNAALAAIAWTPSLSQSTPRFGVIAGANLARFSGHMYGKPLNRTGFAAGLMAALPVAPRFAIQPELMFTMKGAHSDSGRISATDKIGYIEVPVLARFEIPTRSSVKPFVYGGPGFAYRTSCTLEGHYAPGAVMGFQGDITRSCEEQAGQGQLASPGVNYSRTDVDGIIGGGLAFRVGGRTMTVSARYDVGFVKFLSDADLKNRVLSLMGTVEWPFRK